MNGSVPAMAGTSEPSSNARSSPSSSWGQFWFSALINLLVIWQLNAVLAPGINESHYLPKAKHLWNPAFAPDDLFLASGNAHWLFANIAGLMCTVMSLTATAWVGRIVSWIAVAAAWQHLCQTLKLPRIVGPIALAGWLLLTRYGNWAGEWAVGGFEAKSLAYPCIVLALSWALGNRWPAAWIACGCAVAFHPLVGGWAGLSLFGAWAIASRTQSPWTKQGWAWLIALFISLLGLAPAVAMLGGPERSGEIVVAQIHAFYRLAHHQSPHLFWTEQHLRGGATLGLFLLTAWVHYRARRNQFATLIETAIDQTQPSVANPDHAWRVLGMVACCALALSFIGLLIDLVVIRIRPSLAAGLLRFYWFRWTDIIIPLVVVLFAWDGCLRYASKNDQSQVSASRIASTFAITVLVLVTLAGAAHTMLKQWKTEIAPADETLLMSDSATLRSGPEVVRQWQAVCQWISENTPSDALFLTPRSQQSFKWYAGRAEVVTFKDVPQDSKSLLEWYDRIGRCAPPRNAAMEPLGWTTEQLMRLQRRYNFQYVVVDRRIQRQPPLLQLVYPTAGEITSTYAIFKFPQAATH